VAARTLRRSTHGTVAPLWHGAVWMTHATIVTLAVLGVVGQVVVAVFLLVGAAALAGWREPLRTTRAALWGYELWAGFLVAAVATAGSLFFSLVADFVPCELCWYQRICMYPLALLVLFAAVHSDYRIVRYLLPFPVIGAGISIYHLLVENHVVGQSQQCLVSAPGGCAVKWIDEFGYMTIPTLALTGFMMLIALLALAAAGGDAEASTLAADG
jgi:disulfide bond formation protein DsbB